MSMDLASLGVSHVVFTCKPGKHFRSRCPTPEVKQRRMSCLCPRRNRQFSQSVLPIAGQPASHLLGGV